MLRIEQSWGDAGAMAPIFLPENTSHVRFEMEGDGQVEFSFASKVDVKRGRAGWAKYDGGKAGALYGVSVLRAIARGAGKLIVIMNEIETDNVEVVA